MSWLLSSKDELDKFKCLLREREIDFCEEGSYFGIKCSDEYNDHFSIHKIGEQPNSYYSLVYDGTGGYLKDGEVIRTWPSEESKDIINEIVTEIKKM